MNPLGHRVQPVKRLTTGFIALAAAASLGACSDTNFSAQTNQQYQAAEGANARGDVNSMNTLVVVDESGKGVISAALVNKTDDEQTLRGVTATRLDEDEQVAVAGPAAPITIAANELVTLGSTPDNRFVLTGLTPGEYLTLTFTFDGDKTTTVETPTFERGAAYENVAPAQ